MSLDGLNYFLVQIFCLLVICPAIYAGPTDTEIINELVFPWNINRVELKKHESILSHWSSETHSDNRTRSFQNFEASERKFDSVLNANLGSPFEERKLAIASALDELCTSYNEISNVAGIFAPVDVIIALRSIAGDIHSVQTKLTTFGATLECKAL